MSGGIDDLYRDPNAGAYEKEEVRVGPPLDYVGAKLGMAVRYAHRTYREIAATVPDDLPAPSWVEGSAFSIKDDGLLSPAFAAFRSATTAFLALHNMLGLIQDQDKFEALLALKSSEFDAWVERIEREGSVTG
jgi:hypothetical protein